MNKEMLDILNDLSKKPTTGLALQIMELSSENLILKQQAKEQQEVIDKAIEFIKSSQCKYDGWEIANQLYENEIKQLLNILKEVSE